MAVVMQAEGDPAGSIANTVAFSLFAAVALLLAVLVHRDLVLLTRARTAPVAQDQSMSTGIRSVGS